LLTLLREGFAPIYYRSQKASSTRNKHGGNLRRQLNKKFTDIRIISLQVHGHGVVTFAFVRNEGKANYLLAKIERRRDQRRPIETLVVNVMWHQKRTWGKSFTGEVSP
jgi:hypothetical protein